MAQKEKEDNTTNESYHCSQSSSLSLPEPGSQERLLAERKLVRKLDVRLLPVVFILYVLNYIDVCLSRVLMMVRTDNSLPAYRHYHGPFARHAERLTHYRYVVLDGLTIFLLYLSPDVQYATVIAILFVSYCPAQIPSNMVGSSRLTGTRVYNFFFRFLIE
jgi:hypothetical protein